MCGRAVQTVSTSHAAARSLGIKSQAEFISKAMQYTGQESKHHATQQAPSEVQGIDHGVDDNFNMSPGMDAAVVWMENGKMKMDRKVWGLVTKGGSSQNPLPSDSKTRMGMHFSGLMYNARTDTLFEKPTFSRLAHQKRSCVVALDGYFEWKPSPLAGGKGKKQPYFVYRKMAGDAAPSAREHRYLLMAGLWTRIATGIPNEPYLDTFTILTTEASKEIEWLHHRMPVCLWNLEHAKKWLQDPTQSVHKEIDLAAKSKIGGFSWHIVTTEMSSVKFRGKDAIKEKKPPKPVTAFFLKMAETKSSHAKSPAKAPVAGLSSSSPTTFKRQRRTSPSDDSSTPKKRAKSGIHTPEGTKKKNLITSFFQRKSSG